MPLGEEHDSVHFISEVMQKNTPSKTGFEFKIQSTRICYRCNRVSKSYSFLFRQILHTLSHKLIDSRNYFCILHLFDTSLKIFVLILVFRFEDAFSYIIIPVCQLNYVKPNIYFRIKGVAHKLSI
jgi:hypothetical protein